MFYVNCIKCILSDPLIVIESFETEFDVIQKIHLCPGDCQYSQMSSFLHGLKFSFRFLPAEMQRPERQPC